MAMMMMMRRSRRRRRTTMMIKRRRRGPWEYKINAEFCLHMTQPCRK